MIAWQGKCRNCPRQVTVQLPMASTFAIVAAVEQLHARGWRANNSGGAGGLVCSDDCAFVLATDVTPRVAACAAAAN